MRRALNIPNIKAKMVIASMNQRELSQRMGLSASLISKWLNQCSFPKIIHILALSRCVGLPYDDLIVETNQSSDPRILCYGKKRK